MKIPLLRPDISGTIDLDAMTTFSNFGPHYWAAKKMVDEFFGKQSVLVSNGTVAITIALNSLMQPRDKGNCCLVPEFAPGCTIAAVIQAGLTPLVLPCDPVTLTFDLDFLKETMNTYRNLFAVCVNPFGYGIDERVIELLESKENPVKVVYDSAGGWPCIPETNAPITLSLHATKTVGIGEGGIVLLSDEAAADTCLSYANFSYLKKKRQWTSVFGQNAKIDEMRCQMLVNAMEKKGWLKRILRRTEVYSRLRAALEGRMRFFDRMDAPSLLCVDWFRDPTEMIEAAAAEGIAIIRYYWPLLSETRYADLEHPKSSELLQNIVALPSDMTDEEVEQVISFLKVQID
jgi:dTDP-4-amino-4,6-dideoxygalactose transaminase